MVFPLWDTWKLTVLGAWNQTKVHTNDNTGATLTQVALYGKNFGLSNDPATPTYYKYNLVNKHTYFNYAKLNGELTPSLKLENTIYSYYYKNDTESALDPTLSPTDIANRTGLQITQVPGGRPVVNGHVPGYTKLNVYKIYGDILHLDQDLSFGKIKAGLWLEKADTGPRARYDYDATLGRGPNGYTVDYRQKVMTGVPQFLEYLQYSGWKQYEPFVDFEWKPTAQLTITPGIKYLHEKISVDADVNQKSRQPFHGSKTFTKTMYFATANYKIQENLAVYAQYATGFLVPDISTTQAVNPNLHDLKPQTSTNYQAGLVYHGSKFTIDADVYAIDFSNKLQTVVVGTETVNFNLGGAKYRGVEGSVTFAATDNIFIFANGSINSAKASGGATTIGGVPVVISGGKQIANAPKGTAAAGVLYNDDHWSISLLDKYTGVQWGAEGEPAAYRIPGYNSTDLTVVYKLGRYRLEAAVYNLFDSQKFTSIKPGKTVPYDQYYFQPERNFQVSAKAPAVSKFLETSDLDPALILPPPPKDDAPSAVEGRAELHRLAAARSPERLERARHDDEVEDVRSIIDVFGPAFNFERFPDTTQLFADLRNEDSVAVKRAKAYFKRERPFLNDRELDVCDDAHDMKNSYPSGHATMGYATAAVLAQLMPGNAQLFLARANDYAESRLYCGVHYRADIEAGQVLANVLVAKLMTKPAFVAELEAARAELTKAHFAP